jgi:hypothetical protein
MFSGEASAAKLIWSSLASFWASAFSVNSSGARRAATCTFWPFGRMIRPKFRSPGSRIYSHVPSGASGAEKRTVKTILCSGAGGRNHWTGLPAGASMAGK